MGSSQDPVPGNPKGLKIIKVWQHPLKSVPKFNSREMGSLYIARALWGTHQHSSDTPSFSEVEC